MLNQLVGDAKNQRIKTLQPKSDLIGHNFNI